MKNRILSLTIFAISAFAGSNALALVGGPFDNNNYSVLLERGGVYQAALTYSNGSGICQFSEDNEASAQNNIVVDTVFKLGNRSILYYKGVTYAGSCTGMADLDARRIYAITNGTSTLNSIENAGLADPVVVNGGNQVAPGFGYANSQYTAKITSTAPILRFRGSGQAAFVGDTQFTTLRAIATASFNAFLATFDTDGPDQAHDTNTSGTINAGDTLTGATDGGTPITAANASDIIQHGIDTFAQVGSPSTVEANMERVAMRVYGSRRYF